MGNILKRTEMVAVRLLMPVLAAARVKSRHRFLLKAYRRWGMKMKEWPNYVSGSCDVDGTDYSAIYLGRGVTISSYTRLLTHDWSPHTIGKQLGVFTDAPLGRFGGIHIDDYSFVGTNSVVMPGTRIGKGCIIAAGSVVRGNVPDYSLVMGSPGKIAGDTRELMAKWAEREDWDLTDEQRDLLAYSPDD